MRAFLFCILNLTTNNTAFYIFAQAEFQHFLIFTPFSPKIAEFLIDMTAPLNSFFACCTKKKSHHPKHKTQNILQAAQGNVPSNDRFQPVQSNFQANHNQSSVNQGSLRETALFNTNTGIERTDFLFRRNADPLQEEVEGYISLLKILIGNNRAKDIPATLLGANKGKRLIDRDIFTPILLDIFKPENNQLIESNQLAWEKNAFLKETIANCLKTELQKNEDPQWLHQILAQLGKTNASAEASAPLLEMLADGLLSAKRSPEELWQWSQEFEKATPQSHHQGTIDEFSTEMQQTKVTGRNLESYQQLLNISPESLKALKNNSLCLIGGGHSPIKQDLNQQKLSCHVVNIDPICTQPNQNNADKKLPLNFCDPDIPHLAKPHAYQEAWALHSLPRYAMNPTETLQFYQNAIRLLKQNGVLRILPTTQFSTGFNASMRLSRPMVNQTSAGILEKIKQHPELFEMTEHEAEHRAFFRKKFKLPGVSIRLVGSPKKADAFLRDELPKGLT
jgi:hypothetical protein